ncbi:NACHT, LRR and PYD domains-containing protein 12-like [Alligator mississippiensis]|uniref:NACHT, LRR and PYD domains-containing protein 3 n=1 Tax=Alligator mississippiensis TaxID=8496 RepID=A0A151NXK8_ALLMI|nr:NACHT, LRR and PYD domains-containing protein 12-like [Alligator mississippiensis]
MGGEVSQRQRLCCRLGQDTGASVIEEDKSLGSSLVLIDTTNLLIQFYAGDDAVDVSIEVFTLINLRDAAAKLREGKEELEQNEKTPKMPVKVPKETIFQRLLKGCYKEEPKPSPIYPLCQALKDSNCKLKKLQLHWCELTEASWEDLATVFSHWSLIDLDLCRTFMKDCVIRQLCEWMKHPNCKLQRLGLRNCGLEAVGCEYLSSALSTSQTLTELDLRWVNLEDGGVCLLCEGVKHPNCKLKKLSLLQTWDTSQTLTELDLQWNNLEDGGVRLLCEGLKDPNCKLQKLRLYHCGLKAVGCEYLSSALSTSQTLTEFVLDTKKLEDGGVRLLCEGLKHPNCKLQKLCLGHCGLKVADFENLSSALSTSPNLTELKLCETQLEDSGLRLLCEGLKHPECKLKKITLKGVSGSKEMQLEMDAVKERKPDLVIEEEQNGVNCHYV